MKRIILLFVIISILSTLAYAECPSEMVSYWTFDDGTASDAVGSNHGTINGTITGISGKVGQAFNFDGRTNYISIADADSLDISSELTIEGWIKANKENITKIDGGDFHTCVLLNDSQIKCWGYNSAGQLGDGTNIRRNTPVTVLGISTAIDIAVGRGHTCALLNNSSIACWGSNFAGQLGDGTTTSSYTPVIVSGISTATDISAGSWYTCAVLSDGSARCWGYNSVGQLGDGTDINRNTSVGVSGISTATNIAVSIAGNYREHTCVVLSNGSARCWGANDQGQLGDGSTTPSYTPVSVSGMSTAVSIGVGDMHTCALLSSGVVNCWGWNWQGQLGIGSQTQKLTPVTVSGISTAADMVVSPYDNCALLNDGSIKCWGRNIYGEIGDGSTTTRYSPVFVSGMSTAVSIGSGATLSCAILSDSNVKCWGDNYYGQLGDGTNDDKLYPTSIKNKLFTKEKDAYGLYLDNNLTIFGYINSQEVAAQLTDAWHHVALTYNQSAIGLYVNGALKDTQTHSSLINLTDEDIIMGDIKGVLDDIAIYNQSLNSSEILLHYNDGLNGTGYCEVAQQMPAYSTFTSEETTIFSEETNLTNVTGMTLAIDSKGKIAFPSDHSINAESEDYNTNIVIEDASISVNTSALDSTFNSSAILTFYYVDCNYPYVYYSDTATTRYAILSENNLCLAPRCTDIQCSEGTLTVNVSHFSGYAVNGTANLTIDADDPKLVFELVTFTAEYMNATGLIEGATCTISLPDGDHAMNELASHIYNYSTTFATAQTVDYNVTCNKTEESTVFANDTAVINAADIPEFSAITLGFGLIAILVGLFIIRRKP